LEIDELMEKAAWKHTQPLDSSCICKEALTLPCFCIITGWF